MRFLVPTGGSSPAYGVLTTPAHRATPVDIVAGKPWAADNQAFTGKFEPVTFFSWLEHHLQWRDKCLFVAVPDVLGDAAATLEQYHKWLPHFSGWPVAYVAQDGSEDLAFPPDFDALFVGGSTNWKLSQAAVSVIKRAQAMSKHIHIGRVNWGRRYRHFRLLEGSEGFTCDGTRTRFDGKDKAISAWRGYESQPPLFGI